MAGAFAASPAAAAALAADLEGRAEDPSDGAVQWLERMLDADRSQVRRQLLRFEQRLQRMAEAPPLVEARWAELRGQVDSLAETVNSLVGRSEVPCEQQLQQQAHCDSGRLLALSARLDAVATEVAGLTARALEADSLAETLSDLAGRSEASCDRGHGDSGRQLHLPALGARLDAVAAEVAELTARTVEVESGLEAITAGGLRVQCAAAGSAEHAEQEVRCLARRLDRDARALQPVEEEPRPAWSGVPSRDAELLELREVLEDQISRVREHVAELEIMCVQDHVERLEVVRERTVAADSEGHDWEGKGLDGSCGEATDAGPGADERLDDLSREVGELGRLARPLRDQHAELAAQLAEQEVRCGLQGARCAEAGGEVQELRSQLQQLQEASASLTERLDEQSTEELRSQLQQLQEASASLTERLDEQSAEVAGARRAAAQLDDLRHDMGELGRLVHGLGEQRARQSQQLEEQSTRCADAGAEAKELRCQLEQLQADGASLRVRLDAEFAEVYDAIAKQRAAVRREPVVQPADAPAPEQQDQLGPLRCMVAELLDLLRQRANHGVAAALPGNAVDASVTSVRHLQLGQWLEGRGAAAASSPAAALQPDSARSAPRSPYGAGGGSPQQAGASVGGQRELAKGLDAQATKLTQLADIVSRVCTEQSEERLRLHAWTHDTERRLDVAAKAGEEQLRRADARLCVLERRLDAMGSPSGAPSLEVLELRKAVASLLSSDAELRARMPAQLQGMEERLGRIMERVCALEEGAERSAHDMAECTFMPDSAMTVHHCAAAPHVQPASPLRTWSITPRSPPSASGAHGYEAAQHLHEVAELAERVDEVCARLLEAESNLDSVGRGSIAMRLRFEQLQSAVERHITSLTNDVGKLADKQAATEQRALPAAPAAAGLAGMGRPLSAR